MTNFSKTNCSSGYAPKYECTEETFREVDGALRWFTHIPDWRDDEGGLMTNEALAAKLEELQTRVDQLEHDFYRTHAFSPVIVEIKDGDIEAARQELLRKYSEPQTVEHVLTHPPFCLNDDGSVQSALPD